MLSYPCARISGRSGTNWAQPIKHPLSRTSPRGHVLLSLLNGHISFTTGPGHCFYLTSWAYLYRTPFCQLLQSSCPALLAPWLRDDEHEAPQVVIWTPSADHYSYCDHSRYSCSGPRSWFRPRAQAPSPQHLTGTGFPVNSITTSSHPADIRQFRCRLHR